MARKPGASRRSFLVQNALKLTYKHAGHQKKFSRQSPGAPTNGSTNGRKGKYNDRGSEGNENSETKLPTICCHIGGIFYGCLRDSSDIILISPSVTDQQNMLDICYYTGNTLL